MKTLIWSPEVVMTLRRQPREDRRRIRGLVGSAVAGYRASHVEERGDALVLRYGNMRIVVLETDDAFVVSAVHWRYDD